MALIDVTHQTQRWEDGSWRILAEIISVKQMSGIVHPYSAQKKVMAMLKAYFDEAGTSSDVNGAFVVCGYVAPAEEWEKLED